MGFMIDFLGKKSCEEGDTNTALINGITGSGIEEFELLRLSNTKILLFLSLVLLFLPFRLNNIFSNGEALDSSWHDSKTDVPLQSDEFFQLDPPQ